MKRATLPSGVSLLTIEAPATPVVELRAIVRAGAGFGAPGVAELTGELLRDGGTTLTSAAKMIEKLESLGANLSIDAGFDATVFSVAVPEGRADAAVRLLAEMLQKPRFDETEFKRLRDRKVDQAEEALRSGGSLVAMRVAMRDLLAGPYANLVPTSGDFSKVTLPIVRDFYAKFYGAKNVTVVVAGAVNAATKRALETSFAHHGGVAPPKVDVSSAQPPKALRIVICHRPKSVQSDVFLLSLAPERHVDAWPALRVANQTLGGGVASRLFVDVREARGLAYAVRSQIVELAQGPQLFTVYAGTQSPKTAETVEVLLAQTRRLASQEGITSEEASSSARFLRDVFAVRIDSVGALADLAVTQEVLRLGEGYWDRYRAALAEIAPRAVNLAAQTLGRLEHALVVVSGDADVVQSGLQRFGEVIVVSPEEEFRVLRSLPKR